MPRWLSVSEACKRYAVPMQAVAPNALRDRKIPFRQKGRSFWVPPEAEENFIAALRDIRAARRAHLSSPWKSGRPEGALAFDQVYFIRCVEFLKIGIAVNPRDRFSALQIGCPYEMQYLGDFPGSLREEEILHRHFGRHHHRGEWFRIEGALAALVATFDAGMEGAKSRAKILRSILSTTH